MNNLSDIFTEHKKSVVAFIDGVRDAAYQQGRKDAIDEFAEHLINPSNYERYDFDDCLTDSGKANDFFKYVFAIAEQLKEQKNEY